MVKQNHITHVAANKSALNASAPRHRPSAARRAAVWTTLIAFVGQSLVVSAQQVVADPHAAPGQKPRIDSAANGVPLVQIAAPSAAGVSHNQYQDFNIDQRGLILNNARTVTATQQGGYVEGNANLANGSARIILNEVTSSNASRLGGYAEVAGQRAEVVIANPNGITCNGCGFINTSRGVLTTGTPVFGGSGSLDGFRVTQGLINIEGAGLNGANLDQLDLLTRALQLNADIWANNLNVVTGSNQVNYTTLDAQPITGAGGKPAVSLDVAALGGMYANKIRLIGTESGVGVVSKGTIAAKAGDLVVTQTGKVSFAGVTSATGNVTVTGNDSVDNQGTLYSQANVAIDSQGEVRNSGTLAAQANTHINAATVVSSGTLAAGTNRDGTLAATGNLNIDAKQSLSATSQNVAGGNIRFDAAAIALTGATTRGNAIDLNARAGDIEHTGGTLAAADRVAINASGNFINNGATVKAQGAVTMTVGGSTQNTGGTLEAAQALNLTTGSLNNDQGRIVSLSGDDWVLRPRAP